MTSKTTADPLWLRFLPPVVRAKIVGRPNLKKIISNIGWLFSDTIFRSCIGLVVGVWLARYLGPNQYGLLNYALAFVSLFGAFATLGLQDIVVRELVKDPNSQNEIMGTGFTLRFIGGFVALALIFASIVFVKAEDKFSILVVMILGFTLVFQTSEVIKYWFESQVISKYTVWAHNGVLIAGASVKIGLILIEAPLLAFIWIIFTEAFVLAIALFLVYFWRGGAISRWKVSFDRANRLLRDSWPLALSALAIMIYLRIDQIMLGEILDDQAVGIYSVAIRISELWYFIPMAIVASVFPAILEAKESSGRLYLDRLQKLFDLMVVIALVVAIPMTFLSDWIVEILFGQGYVEAGAVLAIHIWAAIFVFIGVAGSRWFIVENRQILSFQRTLLGAVCNIGLNFLLIPEFGVVGSAYATVISYSIADLFFDLLYKETRRVFVMKVSAFHLIHSIGRLLGARRAPSV